MGSTYSANRPRVYPHPQAETQYGPIEGKRYRTRDGRPTNVFLGIPYARPPVGELRFKKPEPPVPWKEVRKCKRYAKRSVQRDFIWDTLDLKVAKGEDCLYLNVVAPSGVNSQFPNGYPVMFYIHGGGNVMDSAVKYHYTNLSRTLVRHDVICVTIQYRLGYLGYFSTGDENCPGNFGLWDQYMALKWVKENVGNFGGDPENITLFGQSAGAAAVDLLSLSPLSRDLFNKAILMGGSAETIWAVSSKAQLVDYCRKKALRLGFQRSEEGDEWSKEENARLMEFLRKQTPDKFEMTLIGERSIIEELRITLTPVIDGEILPKSPKELRKEAPPKTVMTGICQFEGLLFLAIGFRRANARFLDYCEYRASELLSIAAERNPATSMSLNTFRDLYGITDLMRKDKRQVAYTCVAIMGDIINNVSQQTYCQKMAASGSTVYRYIFTHTNPNNTGALRLLLPFR
ncbi:Protein F15A8.6, partial [Aphelenchoides avenae]